MSEGALFSLPPRGWSINRLATELRLDRRTVTNRLQGVTPSGETGDGPVYSLADAARACFGAPGLTNLEELQRRKLEAQTEAAEMDLRRRRGELVSADDVRQVATTNGRIERSALTNWPARIGPLLADEFALDAVRLTAALEREVRRYLEERANVRVESLVDLPPGLGEGDAARAPVDGEPMG